MFNFNLQFFAHKKGVGSTKNGRDSESTYDIDRLNTPEIFFTDSAVLRSIPVSMLVSVEMILCLL